VYKTTADKSLDHVVRCFNIDIPPEVVAAYFYVPPPPPSPTPEVSRAQPLSPLTALLLGATSQPEPETKTAKMLPAPSCRDPRDVAETINRLTRSTRPRTVGNAATTNTAAA